jgi:hypothetical protein
MDDRSHLPQAPPSEALFLWRAGEFGGQVAWTMEDGRKNNFSPQMDTDGRG